MNSERFPEDAWCDCGEAGCGIPVATLLPCGHTDMGRACSVCAVFADAPTDEEF